MGNGMLRLIRRLLVDHRGVVAVELAMAAPILAMLTLSGVEIGRFILLNQKVERVSVTMADLTSQAESLSEGDLNDLFLVTGQVMSPFDLTGQGQVIISSIGAKNGNPPRINWQRSFGALSIASALGAEGANPTLPAGFEVRDSENVIVAEVNYQYIPFIVSDVIDPVTLHNEAYFRPRLGTLESLI